MKKEIVFLSALAAVAASAQTFPAASVILDSGNTSAPIYYLASGTQAPSEVFVEVLARADAGSAFTSADLMSETKNTVYYDSGAYYFYEGAIPVAGITPGASGDFMVRAWTGAATYDEATIRAESPIISQVTGNWTASTSPPPDVYLNFNQGMTMGAVPEPATIALLAIGGAALFFRRRQ